MAQPTNAVIIERLTNLDKNVTEGFKGVHARQDLANHSIAKNTEYRQRSTGSITAIKFIIGFLGIGNLILLVKTFIL